MDMTEHIRQSNLIEGVTAEDEVRQSLLAWTYLSQQQTINLEVILHTHKIVLYNLWQPEAGKLRIWNVTVGGRLCPHYSEVPDLLDSWIETQDLLLNFDLLGEEYTREFTPAEVPKKLHVQFEHIHPFADGNGRTGRLLMWYHQRKLGQEPTLIEFAKRWEYYDWF